MKAWLATQRHWLRVEALPAYAHDLTRWNCSGAT